MLLLHPYRIDIINKSSELQCSFEMIRENQFYHS